MSFKSLTTALAVTASISYAEQQLNLAQLLSLQQNIVEEMDTEHHEPEVDFESDRRHVEQVPHWNTFEELDLAHHEPEVDHYRDSEHKEHIKHFNEMTWEVIPEAEAGATGQHCPVGFTRVGCCKCVHDVHSQEAHLGGAVDHREMPTIHGTGHIGGVPVHAEATAVQAPIHHDNDFHGQMYGGREEY